MGSNQEEISRDILNILQRISIQLGNIEHELRGLRSVMKSSQSTSIRETKALMLKSKLRSQIYELCDGNHTVGQICSSLGRKAPLVSRYLKELEDAGLVLSEQRGKGRFYYKVI